LLLYHAGVAVEMNYAADGIGRGGLREPKPRWRSISYATNGYKNRQYTATGKLC
jgi:hypothetical protein